MSRLFHNDHQEENVNIGNILETSIIYNNLYMKENDLKFDS